MMKRILLLLLLISVQNTLSAQNTLDLDRIFSHDNHLSNQPIKTFRSADEAEGVIRSILKVVGLKPNFEIRAADISNAAAIIYEGERYILYDRDFIQSINNASSTSWAGISILAHEIGHHLNGHTLIRGGSNHKDELEADEFSGFVLRKLGADLEDAQAAMNMLSEDYETSTHPDRYSRLKAIAQGWQNASSQNVEVGETEEEMYAEATYPDPRGSSQRLADQYILREVHFNSAPKDKFYITTNYNFIGVNNDQLVLYGALKKTNDEQFPFVLTDDSRSAVIYVAHNGYLFDANGKSIGFMKEYRG